MINIRHQITQHIVWFIFIFNILIGDIKTHLEQKERNK